MGLPRVTKERPSYPFRSLRVKYKGQLRMFLTRFRYRGIVRCCIIGADEIMNLEYSELSMRPSPRDFSSKLCLRCACAAQAQERSELPKKDEALSRFLSSAKRFRPS